MKSLLVFFLLVLSVPTFSNNVGAVSKEINNDSIETNNRGVGFAKSSLGLGLDLQTKYMWRGMEMMTQNSSPVLFPSVNYSWNGLFVYAMGGYAINGEYAEVDLGLSYTWKSFTVGLNDYYYPTIDINEDNYFSGGKNTGHWLEATLLYTPEKLPLWISTSNFFYGADKYVDEKEKETQAYSTYLEVGSYYDFLDCNRVSLVIGAALNKSCYNGYEKNFSICNIEGKYTYNVKFKHDWILPLSVSCIYNPVFDKAFVNFSVNIAL